MTRRHVSKDISGYCPYLRKDNRILVTYAELNLSGKSSPQYKKVKFNCDYIEECNLRGNCPIKANAPDYPF